MQVLLPALDRLGQLDPPSPGLVCMEPHADLRRLVLLDAAGHIHTMAVAAGSRITTTHQCALAGLARDKLGASPALILHYHAVGVVGARGTALFAWEDGRCLDPGASTRLKEKVGQAGWMRGVLRGWTGWVDEGTHTHPDIAFLRAGVAGGRAGLCHWRLVASQWHLAAARSSYRYASRSVCFEGARL